MLNKEIEANVELSQWINEATKHSAVQEVGADLSDVEKDKLAQLADGIEFNDADEFSDKLNVIKEQYFVDDWEAESVIEDDSDVADVDDYADETQLTGPMAAYSSAISRTVNK